MHINKVYLYIYLIKNYLVKKMNESIKLIEFHIHDLIIIFLLDVNKKDLF